MKSRAASWKTGIWHIHSGQFHRKADVSGQFCTADSTSWRWANRGTEPALGLHLALLRRTSARPIPLLDSLAGYACHYRDFRATREVFRAGEASRNVRRMSTSRRV